VLDPYSLRLARRHDIIPAEPLEAIAREIGFGLPRSQQVLFFVSVVCLGIVLLGVAARCAALLQQGTFSLRGLVKAAGPLTAVWVGPVIFWAGARRTRLQRTVRTMLKHLRCPHCGYDIRGLPIEDVDGATICPECGCAWQINKTGATRGGVDAGLHFRESGRSQDSGEP